MKKILFIVLSVFMLTGVFAKENYFEGADTGELVRIVGQLVPVEQIEIINPTCVVGLTSSEKTDGAPCIMYAYWNGESGLWQNTLGMQLHDSELVTVMIMLEKGFESGAKVVKNWIKLAAPKDDAQIESQIKSIMKQHNKNDKDYVLLRPADSRKGIGRTIVFIYSPIELARKKGLL